MVNADAARRQMYDVEPVAVEIGQKVLIGPDDRVFFQETYHSAARTYYKFVILRPCANNDASPTPAAPSAKTGYPASNDTAQEG